MSVVVQVEQLITPLRDNSKSIFQEGNHNEETSNCWEVSIDSISQHKIAVVRIVKGWVNGMRKPPKSKLPARGPISRLSWGETYGFTGSLKVSKRSSILLVCARMVSRELGLFVSSPLEFPKVF